MEKETMLCEDRFEAKDSVARPIGLVTILGDDGSVLFKGHNMIVNAGRKVILKALFGTATAGSFKFVYDHTSGDITTPSTTMPTTKTLSTALSIVQTVPYSDHAFASGALTGTVATQVGTDEYMVLDSDSMALKAFTAGDTTKNISALVPTSGSGTVREEPLAGYAYLNADGIRMEIKSVLTVSGSDASKTIYAVGLACGSDLFSRCVTDKITVNPNRTLRVYYTLYF